jgi:hypothetical protein
VFLDLKERFRRKKIEKRKRKLSMLQKKMARTTKKKGLPDMPDSPDELKEDLSGSERELSGPGTTEINSEIAGEIVNIPFEIWNSFNPVVLPLSPHEQTLIGEPFSRLLEKWGMGKLSRDEIVFGFWLLMFSYGRYKAVRAAKPKKEKKPDVRDDSWKAGPGQDDAGKTVIGGSPGPGASGSDIHS